MGAMVPPSRKSCYNFRVTEINRVLDGDTIDVTIDLGFDLYKKERVRVAGVDTPEKRTRDLEEKALGIDATNWLKDKLEGAIDGDDELTIRTELKGGMGKYGRLLGWLYVGDDTTSLNEQMIEEGYAWAYDGGTKQKNFEELREIRRSKGTLLEGLMNFWEFLQWAWETLGWVEGAIFTAWLYGMYWGKKSIDERFRRRRAKENRQ